MSLFWIVLWSWLAGIACLFLALQFSPPRFSLAAMDGALAAALRSSLLYVLPPLLALSAWRWRRARVDLAVSALVALLWTMLTVGWWAIHFNPFPWDASLRKSFPAAPLEALACEHRAQRALVAGNKRGGLPGGYALRFA